MIQLTEHEAAVLSNALARSRAAKCVQVRKPNKNANRSGVAQKKLLKLVRTYAGRGFAHFVKS